MERPKLAGSPGSATRSRRDAAVFGPDGDPKGTDPFTLADLDWAG